MTTPRNSECLTLRPNIILIPKIKLHTSKKALEFPPLPILLIPPNPSLILAYILPIILSNKYLNELIFTNKLFYLMNCLEWMETNGLDGNTWDIKRWTGSIIRGTASRRSGRSCRRLVLVGSYCRLCMLCCQLILAKFINSISFVTYATPSIAFPLLVYPHFLLTISLLLMRYF